MVLSLIRVFIKQPLLILSVGVIFFMAHLLLRSNHRLRARALLLPAVAWVAWAVWELVVLIFTPDADIRVDLLLIVPVLIVLTIVGIVRLVWPRRGSP